MRELHTLHKYGITKSRLLSTDCILVYKVLNPIVHGHNLNAEDNKTTHLEGEDANTDTSHLCHCGTHTSPT
jgi:hypothetical protein